MLINLQSNKGMQTQALQQQIKQVLICFQLKNRVALGSMDDDQWVQFKLITPLKYPVINSQCLAQISSIFRINEHWPQVSPALYLQGSNIPLQAQFVNIMEEMNWPDFRPKTLGEILVKLVEEIDKYGLREWVQKTYGVGKQNNKQDENQIDEVNLMHYNKIVKCNNNKNYKQNSNLTHHQSNSQQVTLKGSGNDTKTDKNSASMSQSFNKKQSNKCDLSNCNKKTVHASQILGNEMEEQNSLYSSQSNQQYCSHQSQANQQQQQILQAIFLQVNQNKTKIRQKTNAEQFDGSKMQQNFEKDQTFSENSQPKINEFNYTNFLNNNQISKQKKFISSFSCFKPIRPLVNDNKSVAKVKIQQKTESFLNNGNSVVRNCGFMPYRPVLPCNANGGFHLYGASNLSSGLNNASALNRSSYGFNISERCKIEEDEIKQQLVNHNPLEINYLSESSRHPKPMNKNANLPKFLIRIFIKYVDKYKNMYIKRQYDKLVSQCKKMKQWKKNDRRQHAFGLKHLKIFFQDHVEGFPSPVLNRKVISRIIDNYLLEQICQNSQIPQSHRVGYLVACRVYSIRCRNAALAGRIQSK